MDSRKRLEEAKFFLEQIRKSSSDSQVFEYYVSAFLNSWRSIMDIMLYDVAEYYLGLSRSKKFDEQELRKAAEQKKCEIVVTFVDWWSEKQKILLKNPLWEERNISFHRGYPSMNIDFIYLGYSGGTSGMISVSLKKYSAETQEPQLVPAPDFSRKRFSFTFDPDRDAINVCEEACLQMERTICEAEDLLHVKL